MNYEWQVPIIELKESILENNDQDAEVLRTELKEKKTFYLNVMSSPGAGKTTLLVQTIERLKDRLSIGVMEADIDSDVDAKTIIRECGVPAVQLHTGGMCHLDAEMSRQGLRSISYEDKDLIILENVGNLVCPAEFDTGAAMNAVLLSVPEGDDKPLKYPLMFEKAQVVLVTKTDAMEAFDFDLDRFRENVKLRNPKARVFAVSAATGDGMDAWAGWLYEEVERYVR